MVLYRKYFHTKNKTKPEIHNRHLLGNYMQVSIRDIHTFIIKGVHMEPALGILSIVFLSLEWPIHGGSARSGTVCQPSMA